MLVCAGRTDMKIMQFGWSGERANGFAARLANDLANLRPTVATTCYGMNDGSYCPYDKAKVGDPYEKNMRDVINGLKTAGVKTIIVGSPGAVDTKFWSGKAGDWGGKSSAEGYNANLKQLRDIDEKLAKEFSTLFADVHTPLVDAMAKAKAALGEDYDVCGRDGIHPGLNGQLVMAYAFLKALGCDGAIGEIVVDMGAKNATATDGHKVVSCAADKVELESSRYPFCFQGDAKSGTRSILPFVPFNKDLNRFILKVKGLSSDKAVVEWGTEKKEFTKARLEQGINLAEEFEKTPFDDQFNKVMQAVAEKQVFEMSMIKQFITHLRWLDQQFKDDAQVKNSEETIRLALEKRRLQMEDAAHAAVTPVKHTISVISAK